MANTTSEIEDESLSVLSYVQYGANPLVLACTLFGLSLQLLHPPTLTRGGLVCIIHNTE